MHAFEWPTLKKMEGGGQEGAVGLQHLSGGWSGPERHQTTPKGHHKVTSGNKSTEFHFSRVARNLGF